MVVANLKTIRNVRIADVGKLVVGGCVELYLR